MSSAYAVLRLWFGGLELGIYWGWRGFLDFFHGSWFIFFFLVSVFFLSRFSHLGYPVLLSFLLEFSISIRSSLISSFFSPSTTLYIFTFAYLGSPFLIACAMPHRIIVAILSYDSFFPP